MTSAVFFATIEKGYSKMITEGWSHGYRSNKGRADPQRHPGYDGRVIEDQRAVLRYVGEYNAGRGDAGFHAGKF